MLNFETIKFIAILNRLAIRSKNGIEPFKNATEENQYSKVFYNPSDDFKVISESFIDEQHHDICEYFDNFEYVIKVEFEDNKPYLVVEFYNREEIFRIQNGSWFLE